MKETVLITGGTGMVGHALTKELKLQGYENVFSVGSSDCDLKDKYTTCRLFDQIKPTIVFHLASKVYGIGGNLIKKKSMLTDNMAIHFNVVEACKKSCDVKRVIAMGSGCVYGKETLVPLKESTIWCGRPHESELHYALSKRFLLSILESSRLDYSFVVSCNLYGEYDNFDPDMGHVIPSLIAKFYEAQKEKTKVVAWGDGSATRDFMYSGDMARVLIMLIDSHCGAINIGSGNVLSIKDILEILKNITGVDYVFDESKPNGQPERYYDLSLIKNLGFVPVMHIEKGIERVYNWYKNQME